MLWVIVISLVAQVPAGGAIAGVGMAPDGSELVAAASSGRLSLLELRRGGEELSAADCQDELCCCSTDGELLIAGGKSGKVFFWNLRHQRGMPSLPLENAPDGESMPGPDGLYPPLLAHDSATLAVTASWVETNSTGFSRGLYLVSAHEDGMVQAFKSR